jgi:hypothetical protein
MPKKGAHEGETYLVAPNMRSILFQHISYASLFFLMTAEGAPLIAPIRIPGDGEKEHTAHSSFRQIAVCAEKEWVLAIYNKATGSYEKGTGADFDPPVWPDLTLEQILEKAFRDYHIKDTTHPVVKSLGLFAKPSCEA